MAPARDVVTATRWPGPNCQYRVRHSAPEFTEQGENTNQRMNDEKNTTTSANEKQTRVEEDRRAEPGELANQRVENNAERDRGIMLVDRPPKPGMPPPAPTLAMHSSASGRSGSPLMM